MNCTKAIILLAGYGTRRLPITKAVEKCMLPIGNRPLVDYVVEDCIKAGITHIYFVVSESSDQIRRYYGHNNELETYLREKGKEDMIEQILPRSDIRFHYVTQDALAKYGTAIPVWECRDYINPDEYFLVMGGDDFIFNADGSSEAARLIAAAGEGDGAMLGVEIDPRESKRYGVIVYSSDAEGKTFDKIVEKPDPPDAPSNLINVSKYAFRGDFLDFLEPDKRVKRSPKGEYDITDAINAYKAAGRRVVLSEAKGRYLDGGTLAGWIEANNVVYEASIV